MARFPRVRIDLPEHSDGLLRFIADEIEVTVEMDTPIFLAILASISQGKFDVGFTDNEGYGYTTSTSLFTTLIAESGTGKGPVFRKLLDPLDALIEKYNSKMKKENIRISEENRIHELKKKRIQKQVVRETIDHEKAVEEICSLEIKSISPLLALYMSNGTEAGIRKALATQEGHRISILDSEGSSSKLLVQDTRLPSLLNQAYDHEPISVARAGEPLGEQLKGYVSFALCMQPEKLRKMAHKNNLWDEGLFPRMLPFFYQRYRFHISRRDRGSNSLKEYERYATRLAFLLNYPWKRDDTGAIVPYPLKLDDHAINSWKHYAAIFDRMTNSYPEITPWLMKAKTMILKIAALFHLYELDCDPAESGINQVYVEAAGELLRSLVPSVEYIREIIAPTPHEATLRRVIKWLHGLWGAEDFQLRELYRSTGLKEGAIKPVIRQLCDDGILIPWEDRHAPGPGRLPSAGFRVDCDLLDRLYPEDGEFFY